MMPVGGEGGECFVCVEPASNRYTLVFESGDVIEDKLMCSDCIPEFRELDWLEVHEAPVLRRGENTQNEE
jgi:hypothetical protein